MRQGIKTDAMAAADKVLQDAEAHQAAVYDSAVFTESSVTTACDEVVLAESSVTATVHTAILGTSQAQRSV